MKQKLFKVITALMLIMTMTMSNFLFLCVNFVSYAAETVNADKATNHKNVEFMAYFKDESGNKLTEKEVATNSSDLELYLQISVKNQGYFNGKVTLNNSNFKFKTDVIDTAVSKIENNTIYLNQINAGETKEVVVKIEMLKSQEFDLNLIDISSDVSIEGIYRDSTQKDISIVAKRNVKMIFVAPYVEEEQNIILSQEIITNKIFKIDGENKRVVQIMIKSGIKDNLFPINKTTISFQAPKSGDGYLDTVLVHSNDVLSTNGKYLSEDDWSYNKETGTVEIKLENKQNEGKVSWIKEGTDNLVITYVFYEDVSIEYTKMNVNSQIELYDINQTVFQANKQISLDSEKMDTTITGKIVQNETSMYKGKLYAGIARDITYKNIVDINLDIDGVIDIVSVIESRQTLGTNYLKSVYKTTKINKSDLDKVLGESGKVEIINLNNDQVVSEINKDVQADNEGNVVVTYPENVETIKIRITSPETNGRLEFETTKSIKDVNENLLKTENSINLEYNLSYTSANTSVGFEKQQSSIELKETETSVDLEISRQQLSAMLSNDNVEFRITLNSKEEMHKLFKNPVLNLKLPEKIETIQVNSIDLLYEDELVVKSATLNDKTIKIVLEGEQTKYKEEAVDGAIIIINVNLKTSKGLPTSTEKVKLAYTNDGTQESVEKDIQIVSYAGVVTTNEILEYGVSVVNNEGNEKAELALSQDAKTVNVEKLIINNKENKISDVRMLGIFPTKDAIKTNNIDIEVGNISVTGIDASRVKVYYSNNADATKDLDDTNNGWLESIEDNKAVKKYLIVINELDLLEEIKATYQITIPSNLEYSESAEEGYTVFYNNMSVQEQVNTKLIKLQTPAGAVVETTLKALLAGQEINTIKENEVLRYEITIQNTGSENVENVVVKATVPEGTLFVNSHLLNDQTNYTDDDHLEDAIDSEDIPFTDESKKELEFVIEKLNCGEQIIKYYEIQVQQGMSGKNIENIVTTQYGEVTKKSNIAKVSVEEGNMELKLISLDALDSIVKSGYSYMYVLHITNKSDKEMKNLKVTINTNDILDIMYIDYTYDINYVSVENANSIEVSSIMKGETVKIYINSEVNIFRDTIYKDALMYATVNYDNNEYKSNKIDLIAKSDLIYSLSVTSENSGASVKADDTIVYTLEIQNNCEGTKEVELKNWLPNDVTLVEVRKDGEELLEDQDYSFKFDNDTKQNTLKILSREPNPGQKVNYEIEVIVNLSYLNTEPTEIISEYALSVGAIELETVKITHILEPAELPSDDGDDNTGDEDGDNTGDNENPDVSDPDDGNNVEKGDKIIYGVAWLDENENGQKDIKEKAIEGIEVKLLDVTTNQFVKDDEGNVLTTKTTSTGFYNFSKVVKGQYIVIFEYDTTQYWLTAFEKEEVSNELNSNVISKILKVDEVQKQVAATEIIDVADENISNINIGLISAKKYDLELNKYISKVVVQNNKTQTTEYTDSTLVKQEIDAKQINNTTLVVEYTIKVTNKGDVAGYVKKIADYLPVDYKFNSEMNKDWYQSENNVYCTSLANEAIQPGESKEVKLTVIKEVAENNIGLINNTAEIENSYNELGLVDIDSTEGNKVKGEDDTGSADLIISIRTGQIIMTVSLIISSIIILAAAIFLLKKLIINR